MTSGIIPPGAIPGCYESCCYWNMLYSWSNSKTYQNVIKFHLMAWLLLCVKTPGIEPEVWSYTTSPASYTKDYFFFLLLIAYASVSDPAILPVQEALALFFYTILLKICRLDIIYWQEPVKKRICIQTRWVCRSSTSILPESLWLLFPCRRGRISDLTQYSELEFHRE